jgi:hypothetical protein
VLGEADGSNLADVDQALMSEVRAALQANTGRLGQVYRAMQQGATSNRELIDAGVAANHGAASNLRITLRTILEGRLPKAPSVAGQISRSIGGLLRDNPDFSAPTTRYLVELRSQLTAIATNNEAIEQEEADLERASEHLERSLAELAGVYVYTLPSFLRSPVKVDPDRHWFKVGMTERVAGIRINEQMRATGLPEDPWLARVYTHEHFTPVQVESKLHDLLEAAGHAQATGRHAGREWYATNLEFLDTAAATIGCAVNAGDPEED